MLPDSLARIVDKLLADRVSDPALIALALMPPDAAYVAAQEPVVDPEGVTAARAYLKRALGTPALTLFGLAYMLPLLPRPLPPPTATCLPPSRTSAICAGVAAAHPEPCGCCACGGLHRLVRPAAR